MCDPASQSRHYLGLFLHLSFEYGAFLTLFQDRIDLDVAVAHARVDQDVARHDKECRSVRLYRPKQLREDAKVVRLRTVNRYKPESQEVDDDAAEDKDEQLPSDEEGRDEKLDVRGDHDAGEGEVARRL